MNPRAPVEGERTFARALELRPVATRLRRVLAAALVLVAGAGLLAWYYLQLGQDGKEHAAAGIAGVRSAVASEMRLPALEPSRTPARVPELPDTGGMTGTVLDETAAQGRAARRAAAPA
jgi:hypothetical protein